MIVLVCLSLSHCPSLSQDKDSLILSLCQIKGELKTKIYSHAHSLIRSLSLAVSLLTDLAGLSDDRDSRFAMSLLRPIPASRTCDDMAIKRQHCDCIEAQVPWTAIPADDPDVTRAGEHYALLMFSILCSLLMFSVRCSLLMFSVDVLCWCSLLMF